MATKRKSDNTFLYLAAIAAAYFAFSKNAINGIGSIMRKRREGQDKYLVTYDKKVGGQGTVVVIAHSEESALDHAAQLRYTGTNFRNPQIVDWSTPSDKQGGRMPANY